MTEAVRRTLGIAGLVGVAAAIVVGTIAAETLLHDRDAALDQAIHYGIEARHTHAELLAETGRNELLAGHSAAAGSALSAAYRGDDTTLAVRVMLAAALRDLESYERTLPCDGDIGAIEAAPDGNSFVAACERAVTIWTPDGKQLQTLRAPGAQFTHASFSHDSHRVLTSGRDGLARVWDAGTGELRATLAGTGKLLTARFSLADTRIVTGGSDGVIAVWDASGEHVTTIKTGGPVRATFITDHVVSVASDGVMSVWDEHGALVRRVANGAQVLGGDLDGSTLERVVVCGDDGVARIWNLATGALVSTFAGHSARVWSCTLDRDRRRLLTSSDDGTAIVWDVATARPLLGVQPHGVVDDAIWISEHAFATSSLGGGVAVWDATTGARLGSDERYSFEPGRLTAIGERLIAADHLAVRVWRGLGARAIRVFAAPAGTHVVSASVGLQRVVVANDLEALQIFDAERDLEIDHVALSSPSATARSRVAARTADGIAVVDLATGSTVHAFAMTGVVSRIELSADGRRVVAVADRTSVAWDVDSGVQLASWDAGWIIGALSDDGARVIAVRASSDPHVEIWQLDGARSIQTIAIGRDFLDTPRFDHTGTRLIAKTGHDAIGSIVIWDVATGRRLRDVRGALGASIGAEHVVVTLPDHVELWTPRDAQLIGSLARTAWGTTADVTDDGVLVALAQPVAGMFEIRDLATDHVIASVPLPREASLGVDSYQLRPSTVELSPDGARAVATTAHTVIWLDLSPELRPPGTVANIVARDAPCADVRLVARLAAR